MQNNVILLEGMADGENENKMVRKKEGIKEKIQSQIG